MRYRWEIFGCTLALCLVFACKQPSHTQRAALAPEALTGGRLVFSDDFQRSEPGADWSVADGGDWHIVDGRIQSSKAENRGIWLKRPLPEEVRIEFTVRSRMPANGPFRGDVKCEMFATEPDHQKGYIAIFGGWQNTVNTIARLDEHQPERVENNDRRVLADRDYRFAIVRVDDTVHWILDGKPFLRYDDPQPIRGRYFGFNNWQSDVEFDDLKIFEL